MPETPDLYAELKLDRSATPAEITVAYRRRARVTHPDAGGTPEAFAATKFAFDILSDPEKRETYDETGTVFHAPSDAQVVENAVHILDVLFSGLLDDEAPNPEQFDPLALMKTHLRAEAAKIDDVIRGLGRKHARAKRLRERIAPRSGAPKSKVVEILKMRVRLVGNEILQKQFELACHKRAVLILEEHWLADPNERQPAGWFRLTTGA